MLPGSWLLTPRGTRWPRKTTRSVGAVMDPWIAHKRWVVDVGVPIPATGQRPVADHHQVIEEAAKRARAVDVGSFTFLRDPNRNDTQNLANAAGHVLEVRTPDGSTSSGRRRPSRPRDARMSRTVARVAHK